MQSIPVDQSRVGTLLALSVAADVDPTTGEHRANREGVPAWKIECLHRPEQTGDFAPRAGVEMVKIHSRAEPRIESMAPVRFEGLTARMWEMNGRSGLSLSAEGIASLPAPKGGE